MSISLQLTRDRSSAVDSPIEIVEERQEIHAKLYPSLSHRFVECVRVHDLRWIVEARSSHTLRTILIAPNMVCNQRNVQQQAEPFAGEQEEDVDENVHTVLGQHEGIQ